MKIFYWIKNRLSSIDIKSDIENIKLDSNLLALYEAYFKVKILNKTTLNNPINVISFLSRIIQNKNFYHHPYPLTDAMKEMIKFYEKYKI